MDLTAMLGASFVGAFLYAFTTLLPVINPFSGAMFFVTLTGHLSDADRSYVAGPHRSVFFDYFDGLSVCWTHHSGLFWYFRWSTSLCRRYCAFLPRAGMP